MPLAPFERVKESWRSLPMETRFSLTILTLCGSTALVMSVFYLRSSVIAPFQISRSVLKPAQALLAQQDSAQKELEASKTKDTDHDGLSDYSELYQYKTSPYLADTDSDGVPDAIEIAQNSDPNCPLESCVQTDNQQPTGSASSSFSDLINVTQFATTNDPNAPAGLTGPQQFIKDAKDPASLTVADMRTALTKYNLVATDKLGALNDDAVRAVYTATYQQVLKMREGLAKTAAQASSTSPTP